MWLVVMEGSIGFLANVEKEKKEGRSEKGGMVVVVVVVVVVGGYCHTQVRMLLYKNPR